MGYRTYVARYVPEFDYVSSSYVKVKTWMGVHHLEILNWRYGCRIAVIPASNLPTPDKTIWESGELRKDLNFGVSLEGPLDIEIEEFNLEQIVKTLYLGSLSSEREHVFSFRDAEMKYLVTYQFLTALRIIGKRGPFEDNRYVAGL